MPFELIMLMGFFGTILLTLLPATPAKTAGESFREPRQQRRSDGADRGAARHGRARKGNEATRRRSAGRAVA